MNHIHNFIFSSTRIFNSKIKQVEFILNLTQYIQQIIISSIWTSHVSSTRWPQAASGYGSGQRGLGIKTSPATTVLTPPPTHLAAITGIHGVSSSEWFPINQSTSGKRVLSFGVIALSYKKDTEQD